MNYWLINGIGIDAVNLSTALHKYGQWIMHNKGKPTTSEAGRITWRRTTKKVYDCCSHKW